jgi:hypothetical protein
MAGNRGVFQGPAPTNTGQGAGGYEYADHVLKEPHGPTYDMVVSQKDASTRDPQDAHFLGQLMMPAHSRPDEARSFFDATSITG